MASRYDDELWELVPEDPGPPSEHLREFVDSLGRVERALDLGCGDGRLTAALDAAELTAADVSAVALERARRRLPDAHLAEARWALQLRFTLADAADHADALELVPLVLASNPDRHQRLRCARVA